MKKNILLLVILFFISTLVSCSQKEKVKSENLEYSFYVANWNVENLFDVIDDPDKNDEEFLPSGSKEWTERKLINKMTNLARVIEFMNDGNGPDILGVEEVENEALLIDLTENYLENKNYKIAYSESPDARGIDNGLIYNSEVFGIESVNPLSIQFDEPKSSRDILFVQLVAHKNKEVLNVFVNHWPSRREGLKESEKFRINAAETLLKEIDKLKKENPNPAIIILGDFNDLPANISISKTLNAKPINCEDENRDSFLQNITYNLFQKGEGSYKYKDNWNMLDQIIISNSLLDKVGIDYICNSFIIIKPDFMVEQEGKYKGTPWPTFGGRKYLGGYSDHFPVGAKFIINN
ncbi:MAG: hypothetical protein KDC67_04000 [Ignavibacteriae bacterium]|nr:hypothetical protein [Ignavibacteriota bacterium]